ncbi:radical SAM protein [Moritella sp. Urea-trap-13]|uniref:radical SAM protein n=1 Tax=Moritella sp. Urea-trap-13 TaxID=2058327 RepID=UPI000C34AC7B|nr:radical SAM protein [Moritella sp. Urea-trap-13]PKH04803.1 hypothetical protein CXF93_21570 [Moritella sp. Urea-trap-13]
MNYIKQLIMGNYGSHGNPINFVRSKFYNKYPYMFLQSAFPSAVEVELTNDCNFRCPHCPRTHNMTRPVGYMDLKLVLSIISEIAQHPRSMLRIVGLGEPAMHPDLKDILTFAKNKNVVTEFTTNGTLLEVLTPDEVINSGIDYLGVSIDGFDAASYGKRRVGGDYETVKRNVQLLHEEKEKKHSNTPIVAIRNVAFRNDDPEKLNTYKLKWFKYAEVVSFNTFTPNRPIVTDGPYKRCHSIKFELKINWNGDVPLCRFQCAFREEEIIQNAHDSTLKDIWMSPRLQAARTIHRKKDLDKLSYCKSCPKVQISTPTIRKFWK